MDDPLALRVYLMPKYLFDVLKIRFTHISPFSFALAMTHQRLAMTSIDVGTKKRLFFSGSSFGMIAHSKLLRVISNLSYFSLARYLPNGVFRIACSLARSSSTS